MSTGCGPVRRHYRPRPVACRNCQRRPPTDGPDSRPSKDIGPTAVTAPFGAVSQIWYAVVRPRWSRHGSRRPARGQSRCPARGRHRRSAGGSPTVALLESPIAATLLRSGRRAWPHPATRSLRTASTPTGWAARPTRLTEPEAGPTENLGGRRPETRTPSRTTPGTLSPANPVAAQRQRNSPATSARPPRERPRLRLAHPYR